MAFPREILNELMWHPGGGLERAEVTYVHRGAPGDVRTISGREIVELGRSFFSTEDSSIPYHRIILIRLISPDGKVERSWEFK